MSEEYYANLLIIQYSQKEKAVATVTRTVRAILLDEIAFAVRAGFDFDTAIGNQLDVVGKYVGSDRIITGTSFSREYYGYALYGDTSPYTFTGFTLYGEIDPDAQFRDYRESEQGLFSLNDGEFRFILRLKLVINSSIASTETIDGLLEDLFDNDAIFTDRENMTVSYIFPKNKERLVTIARSEGLLPKPAAVGVIVSVTPDINNIFGYGSYGEEPAAFVVGYGEYGVTSTGGWVFYG